MKIPVLLLVSLGLGVAFAAPVSAQELAQKPTQTDDLERRVLRLERLIENRILEDLLTRLEDLQRELTQLRGQQEVNGHEIGRLLDRQRQLYRDVDRRLVSLERGVTTVATAPPSQTPATASASEEGAATSATPEDEGAKPRNADAKDDAAAQAAYEQAFNLLTEGRYEQAQGAFREFLAAHPYGVHADNAQYWLAESHYLSRDFDQALEQFQALLDRYPDSPKAPKAKLKIGFVYFEKGDWATARKALEAVVRQHPGSASARLAQQRLTELQREER